MLDSIVQLLSPIIPVSEQLKRAVSEKMKIEVYPKKTFLLKRGDVANRVYFIYRGIIRAYYLMNDQEVTRLFLLENDIAISSQSFFNRQSSTEFLVTLEECELAYIDRDDLMDLSNRFKEFYTAMQILTQRYYLKAEATLKLLRGQNAEDRYAYLLANHPEYINRIPVKYLASYLAMSIENLSRIRSKLR